MHSRPFTLNDEYMRPFGFEERNWWQTPSTPARGIVGDASESGNNQAGLTEAQQEAESTSTRSRVAAPTIRESSKDERKKAEADYEASLGSFSAVYTQSSLPIRANKADQTPRWTSPESEK
jgi:hypothetical protein